MTHDYKVTNSDHPQANHHKDLKDGRGSSWLHERQSLFLFPYTCFLTHSFPYAFPHEVVQSQAWHRSGGDEGAG